MDTMFEWFAQLLLRVKLVLFNGLLQARINMVLVARGMAYAVRSVAQ